MLTHIADFANTRLSLASLISSDFMPCSFGFDKSNSALLASSRNHLHKRLGTSDTILEINCTLLI